MRDPTALREIIERLEKLGGEVDETRRAWLAQNLSRDIHAELLNPIPKGYHRISSSGRYLMASNRRGMSWSESVPDYTASLDAAVALVEKMLPGWVWDVSSTGTAWLLDPDNNEEIFTATEAKSSLAEAMRLPASPAIALLIALFRALEQKP